MGGKNAIVVDEAADLDAAADAIVTSAFGFQGGKCSACSRAVIVDAVYEKVVRRIVERSRQLVTGDPAVAETDVGLLIDQAARRKVFNYIDIGRSERRLLLGGGPVPGEDWYVAPTIFTDIAPAARIAQEEIFGPVLTIIRAQTYNEAWELPTPRSMGLTGSLFSRHDARIANARGEFHVGNLYFNRKCTGALVGVHPFGGFNMRGTDSKADGPDYLLFSSRVRRSGTRSEAAIQ